MSSSSIAGSILGIVSPMTGATSTTAGTAGSVPAAAAGDQTKALLGSGLWGDVAGADTVQSLTATGSATAWASLVLVDATAGNVIVTLPAASGNIGKTVKVVKTDVSANTVTVAANGADTMNSLVSLVLGQQHETLTAEATTTSTVRVVHNLANGVLAEFGESLVTNGSTFTTTLLDIAGSSFTLPSVGTYEVSYDVFVCNTSAATQNVGVYTNAGVLVAGSTGSVMNSTAGFNLTVYVGNTVRVTTTTASEVFKLRGQTSAGTATVNNDSSVPGGGNRGNSKVVWRKIGGFSPVSGQTVDYVNATLTNASVTGNVPYAVVTQGGNIPNSSGVFTLTAGKTYRLQATFSSGNIAGSAIRWQWYNQTTSAYIGTPGSSFAPSNGGGEGSLGYAEVVLSPSVTTLVHVRDTGSYTLVSGTATIQQLGTSSAITTDYVAEFNANTSITDASTFSTTLADIGGSSFTLPGAGVWEVAYRLFASASVASNWSIGIYDSSNVLVANTQSIGNPQTTSEVVGLTNSVTIQTTGAATYKLRGIAAVGTVTVRNTGTSVSTAANSRIDWKKIGGFTPSSGTIVDYVNVQQTVSQSTGIAASSPILFNTPATIGNIAFSSNTFTLTAGKTYHLQGASGAISGAADMRMLFQWRDTTNNVFIGNQGARNGATGGNNNGLTVGQASAIVTPSSSITVQLWITSFNAGTAPSSVGSSAEGFSWATITQIGSTATTAFTGATATLAGTGGFVPAPAAGDNAKLLCGDGTFSTALIDIRTLTSGTSYVPTSGTNKIVGWVIGGGGGGGNCASAITTLTGGGAGAGGVVGFLEDVSDQTTYTYAIGAAGTASSNGGNTTITVNANVYTGNGGGAGNDGTTNAPSMTGGGIGGTTVPTSVSGNAFFTSDGGNGFAGVSVASNSHATGAGGSNMFCQGGRSTTTNTAGSSAGLAPLGGGFGGGGSGSRQNNSVSVSGSAGKIGGIIIYEYR